MFHPLPARWLATLPAIAAWAAATAQTPPTASPSSPAEPQPPSIVFRSALEGYRSFAEDQAIPWKEANDTALRRGGWRAYAEEASRQDVPADARPPAGGAIGPHAGHSMPAPARKEQP